MVIQQIKNIKSIFSRLRLCRMTWYYLQATFMIVLFTNSTLIADVYRIRHGDNLLIAIIGQPEYSQTVQVRADGRISYFGGDLEVVGKTTEEIKDEIQLFLLNKKLITNPIIMVSLFSQENGVFVGGAVKTPGRYLISPESDIDIYRAIALAGGMTENADPQQVQLIKHHSNFQGLPTTERSENLDKGTKKLTVNVETYDLSTEQAYKDIRVHSNDLVYVARLSLIEVQGEVKNPGKVSFHKKLSFAEALARAGGFTEEADRTSIVKVNNDGTLDVLNIDEQFWKDTVNNTVESNLSDGEVLFVPNAYKQEPIYVTGYVRTPGAHRVRGPLTIQKAIALAGGFEKEANQKKVHIHRTDGTTLAHILEPGKDDLLLYPGDILEIDKRFEVNWGLISTISTTVIGVTYFIINLVQN